MSRPLYRDLASLSIPPTAHPGLVFDKFSDGWTPDGHIADGAKPSFYRDTVRRAAGAANTLQPGLKTALARRQALVDSLGGATFRLVTESRLVSGLGTGHPFDAGFVWHRTLGIPYLPGSSLKGVAREWMRETEGADQAARLFGPEGSSADRKPATGALIVFDGLPVAPPILEVDVMNPHYGDYYVDVRGRTPPASYHSPIPVSFLTVSAGQSFVFAVARRPGFSASVSGEVASSILAAGQRFLREALTAIGAEVLGFTTAFLTPVSHLYNINQAVNRSAVI